MKTLLLALSLLASLQDRRPAQGTGAEVGKDAPAFKLKSQDGKTEVDSAKLRGKPTLLIFGSYTWPPFRQQAAALEKLYATYKDRAAVYVVYILEAHPQDGWKVKQNEQAGIKVDQPKAYEDRVKVAGDCMKDLKLSIPCLVDDMENTAQKAYAGWPDRLYVLDKDGKVAFRGEPGPRGFKPGEAEDALKKELAK